MAITYCDGKRLKRILLAGAKWLNMHKDIVDELNVFPVPDGDTGTNMALTLLAARDKLSESTSEDLTEVAREAADSTLMGARGNSGVILSQILRGFTESIDGKSRLNSMDIALAMRGAAEAAYKAVVNPVEGTILTVIKDIANAAVEIAKEEKDILQLLKRIERVGQETLSRTPEMLDVLKEAGVVDAGGKGLLYIFEGIIKYIQEGEILEDISRADMREVFETALIPKEELKYGYCTEFLIKGGADSVDTIRETLSNMGDSLIAVGSGNLTRVHIHTNNPGLVIEYALQYGELSQIKVDNMREQHKEVLASKEMPKERPQARKPIGVVSVAFGDGIAEIMRGSGCDVVVKGGQTMNPSVESICKAIREVNADNVFILPNNENVIFTARQTQNIIQDKNVIVIPTRTIPQGISTLLALGSSQDPDKVAKEMERHMRSVKTGEVTRAVRDSVNKGRKIEKGDFIGLLDRDIAVIEKSYQECALRLVEEMLDDDSEVVTIFYGEDATENDADDLVSRVERINDSVEVGVYRGGQPHYYYIISVE
ncbi:MAG: DAK2 domain-containing protein [bacterium]